jgi:hypothetical protein
MHGPKLLSVNGSGGNNGYEPQPLPLLGKAGIVSLIPSGGTTCWGGCGAPGTGWL